jgi:hypothetical protein
VSAPLSVLTELQSAAMADVSDWQPKALEFARIGTARRRSGPPRRGRVMVAIPLAVAGLLVAAPAQASSGKLNTFALSNGLTGTLRLVPNAQTGCQTPGYLSDLTGKVAGIKLHGDDWELAINETRVGTFKASDSIASKAHVTLQPPTRNAIENTLTNIGGLLKVTGADAASGSVDLRMSNVTGSLKTTIMGSWRCPTGT